MKRILSILLVVVFVISSFSVTAFAVSKNDANTRLATENEKFNNLVNTKFDVNGSGKIDAADARTTLLYSAGLALDSSGSSKMDTDGDGVVTAIDARNILRISAKLDNINNYLSISDTLDYFDAIIDSIKPNRYKYTRTGTITTESVTYDDYQGVVAKLDKQLSSMSKYLDEEPMRFSDELVATSGSVDYNGLSYQRTYTITDDYPVANNEGSLLTVDNVSSVVYKQNQSFTYSQYKSDSTPYYTTNTLTGLDSITVYIKPDSLKNFPDDLTTLNNGKIFNVLTEEDVMQDVEAGNTVGGMEEIGSMGTCEFGVGFLSMKYHDSFVTVYINPKTGIPVAVDYNMKYDVSMYMDMKMKVSVSGMLGSTFLESLTTLIDVDGRFNIYNTYVDRTVYAFWNADPEYKYTITNYQPVVEKYLPNFEF